MINTSTKPVIATLITGIALLLSACSPEPEAGETTAGNILESNIQLLEAKPGDPLPVKAARAQLSPGQPAVVTGQVGGSEEPFFDGYAGFVLADTAVRFCNEMGDDHCPTPWDACCEDPDSLKSSRASVQFVDAAGLPVAASLKGFAGLEPLRKVVVTGTVASSSTPENLIIEAQGLYLD